MCRFQDGRLLFETLKAFHKIGGVLKTAERVFFDSNTEVTLFCIINTYILYNLNISY